MKTLIYFTNLVSICMNTWINTLFYIRLFLVCVISSLIWISSLILCTTSLYALAGPKIGQIKSCILYLVSCMRSCTSCSKNRVTDKLCTSADLHLCFHICKRKGFLMMQLV